MLRLTPLRYLVLILDPPGAGHPCAVFADPAFAATFASQFPAPRVQIVDQHAERLAVTLRYSVQRADLPYAGARFETVAQFAHAETALHFAARWQHFGHVRDLQAEAEFSAAHEARMSRLRADLAGPAQESKGPPAPVRIDVQTDMRIDAKTDKSLCAIASPLAGARDPSDPKYGGRGLYPPDFLADRRPPLAYGAEAPVPAIAIPCHGGP